MLVNRRSEGCSRRPTEPGSPPRQQCWPWWGGWITTLILVAVGGHGFFHPLLVRVQIGGPRAEGAASRIHWRPRQCGVCGVHRFGPGTRWPLVGHGPLRDIH